MTLLLGAQGGWAQQAGQEPGVVVNGEGQAGQPMGTAPVDTSSVTILDRITIVSRTGESAIEQMASVSHVDQEQLERRMAATPQDVLFGVPGVALQSDANRTASSVNIRGLQDYGRVAVIVDGARQDFQRSGHGTQSMFWLDPELVQQVDIIRGPVANTYGSGAIGGVVMFETKDAGDFLRDGETWAASASGQFNSNGTGWTTSGSGAYRFSDSFDVLGNIVWRDFDEYEDGNGDDVSGSAFDILSGMLKSTIRPTDNSELKLGWIGAKDSWEEGGGTSDLETKQNTFTGRYNIKDENESWLDLHLNVAYNKTNLDQTYLTDVERFSSVTGLPIIVPAGSQTTYDVTTPSFDLWNTSRFDTGAVSHELTYGGDWVQDDVETNSPEGGSDIYTPSGKRRVSGAYIQEKLVWEWLEVVGALRYDSYELDSDVGNTSGDRLSPRITVGVSPFEQLGIDELGGLQLYGTYAEGYRSPSLSETLISGLHPNGVVFPFLPNPNLKPETAKTVEFGINYSADGAFRSDDQLRIKAAYFRNDVDNYISGRNISRFSGNPDCPFVTPIPTVPICFQYQNFASAKIDGFELEAVYDADSFFAGLTVSVTDGYTVNDDGYRESLLSVPPYQATATLGFRAMDNRLTFGGEVQYNGAGTYSYLDASTTRIPDDMTSYRVDDYTLVNLFASYEATDDLKFNARIDNLLNQNYMTALNAASATTPIYEPGISFKVGATMRFGG